MRTVRINVDFPLPSHVAARSCGLLFSVPGDYFAHAPMARALLAPPAHRTQALQDLWHTFMYRGRPPIHRLLHTATPVTFAGGSRAHQAIIARRIGIWLDVPIWDRNRLGPQAHARLLHFTTHCIQRPLLEEGGVAWTD